MKAIQINEDGTVEKVKKSDIVKDIKNSKKYALMPEQREFLVKDIRNNPKLKFNQKHLVIAYLTMYAGLRRGEAVQTRREWLSKVNMVDREGVNREFLAINIPYRANDVRKGKGKFIWKAKTRKSERMTIIFDEKISTYIEAFYENNPTGIQCSEDYIYKVVASNERYSFKSRLQNADNEIIDLHEKERLKNLKPHSLRSTYAFICKEKGMRDEHIAELLGHDDVKTLKDSYFQNTKQGLILSISESFKK